jgi:hypothetical protein
VGGDKLKRIKDSKTKHGSRKEKKLKKYSRGFNETFVFFLKSYRCGILTFCGSHVDIEFDINDIEGKNCFRKYDNGQYKNGKPIISRHPNIVKGVITGKKSWGLFLNQWSDGIVEGSFRKIDILNEFEDHGITIPEPLLLDFENRIISKMIKKFR